MGDDVLRRGGQVVGEVPDAAPAARALRRHRGRERAGDVGDMDAAEHLAGLDDAPRGAGAEPVEGAAPGAVDAGQAEDVQGEAVGAGDRAPAGLGVESGLAAVAVGTGGRVLVDPAAAVVAIDAGGREIAQPARSRGADRLAQRGEHRVAALPRRHRDQHMAGAVQVVAKVAPGPGAERDRAALRGPAGGAGHGPALREQERRQMLRDVAVAEGEEMRHGGVLRRRARRA